MKKCSQCGREYDNTMMFCLDDGAELLYGPASMDEPATAILHSTAAPGEAPTRAQINTTDQTAILRTGAEAKPRDSLGELSEKHSFSADRAAKPLSVAAVVLAILVGGFFGYRYFKPASGGPINSIAVLPFQNKSGDPNSEYLSDGLAESLIYRLSQIPELKVSPTSSVIQYKGKDTKVATIASELGVDAVMTGRLAQIGDNLTISVELVDVRNNKLLWGEQYERKMSELLATQREIATAITEKLQLKLSGDDAKSVTKHYTDNSEAYQFYLKGRYFWNKRTAEGIKKAIEQFQQAIDRDPNFALAYVGVADCYLLMEQYAGTPATETVPKARAAAERALQIDTSLAEAHTSMGSVNEKLWKWEEAGEEYRRAISLNPNYPTARQWYYIYLKAMKRSGEAEEQIRRGEELDPLSPVININFAQMYLLKGETDRATEQLKRVKELYPSYPGSYDMLAEVYIEQRRYREALDELTKAVEFSGRASYYLAEIGYCYALAGRRADALATVKELEAKYARRESPATDIARVYAGLGDKDQAFAWLEKAFEARSGSLKDLAYEEYFGLLRDDSRYADLVRRMGLPE